MIAIYTYKFSFLSLSGEVNLQVSFSNGDGLESLMDISSLAGLYSRWKDKDTDQYYYSYTILTTKANHRMEYVHNAKKRMPVIIPKEFEKDWLNKSLTKDDVLALCQPFRSEGMRANTISKLITDKQADTNVEDVLKLHNYEKVGTDEIIYEL